MADLVYQRPGSNFWYYRFKHEGVAYRGSTKKTSRAEAIAFALEEKRRVVSGESDRFVEMTLEAVAERWMEGEGGRSSDARNNRSRIEKLFGGGKGADGNPIVRHGLKRSLMVHRLSNMHLDALKLNRVREGNSLKTINRELSLLQTLLREAKAASAKMPQGLEFATYKTPETGRKARKLFGQETKRRAFTANEERLLLLRLEPSEAKMQDQYDLAILLLDTGGRYGEGAEVRWDTVNFERRTVNLYRDKVGDEGAVPMTERMFAMLLRRWNARSSESNPYIFPSRDGKGVRGYAVKGIRNAIEDLGLNTPDLVARFGRIVPAHSFRHTFATKLLMANMSPLKVAHLLGHTDTKMVEEHYGHLLPKAEVDEARAILNELNAAPSAENVVAITAKRTA